MTPTELRAIGLCVLGVREGTCGQHAGKEVLIRCGCGGMKWLNLSKLSNRMRRRGKYQCRACAHTKGVFRGG